MLNYNIKFLSCDDCIQLKNGDFKTSKYETKKRTDESIYDSAKRSFCERRCGYWRAPRPRQIRQLDAKLRDKSIVVCEWTTESLITIVFSNGAIAYLTIKPGTLDVLQILFDRYCVGKLSGQTVTGAIISQSHLVFTHSDRLATVITYGKNVANIPFRISDRDPQLQTIELGGARRSDRKLSACDSKGNLKLLVWSTSSIELAPWSPVLEDHANLHLYNVKGHHISLAAYHQLENETLLTELSCKEFVHIIEQKTCHKNGVNLNWLRYNVSNNNERPTKLSSMRESETHVSLPAPARTVRRSPCDLKILVACIDGSLHVIHNVVGVTHSVRAGFIATEVWWAGDLIIAAEEGGRIQCFDRALSLLHHHTKCFDLATYLRDPKRMQILAAQKARAGPIIFLTFAGGPLALLHITHPRLLTSWLRAGRSSNAVSLLRALDWDEDGMECLWAVNKLVCFALRSGTEALSEEGCAQAALGAYLCPSAPLPPAAARYAPPLHDLARKFFHHLLRRGRIEKALSLAVDLRAWDLFVDARWSASRRGLASLADEATALLEHYAPLDRESDCSDSCSQCSSHSYSDDTSVSDGKIKPPPLPRVSLPTVMPVPISQTESTSTNSIRPNLHQYLERNNTIWTTNVDDAYVKITSTSNDRIKPILLKTQNVKWEHMSLNQRLGTSMPTLAVIDESPSKSLSTIDVLPKQDRLNMQFRNLYQTEFRDQSNVYRYHNNNYHHSCVDTSSKYDSGGDRGRIAEKNKVKFSDTVTIAVVAEPPICPESARELADSLPLCPPHKYLAAFAPHPRQAHSQPQHPQLPHPQLPHPQLPHPPLPHPSAGTTLDYVEV
ncbi:unnamed protein product [Diatraea saccharalis]|uniref:WD repeat-containing and planar cell polarity effector protein fritz n=1 Tax=Diatraea saccharalis TaxID=40085 RepID=A0A9N9QXU5_9NEOP|nr:unnamed protein product [Diatraea saccharalis]